MAQDGTSSQLLLRTSHESSPLDLNCQGQFTMRNIAAAAAMVLSGCLLPATTSAQCSDDTNAYCCDEVHAMPMDDMSAFMGLVDDAPQNPQHPDFSTMKIVTPDVWQGTTKANCCANDFCTAFVERLSSPRCAAQTT